MEDPDADDAEFSRIEEDDEHFPKDDSNTLDDELLADLIDDVHSTGEGDNIDAAKEITELEDVVSRIDINNLSVTDLFREPKASFILGTCLGNCLSTRS